MAFQATGARGGAIVQAIFTIVLAISAGIYHEWKLGLVGALFVPVVLVGSTAQAKIIASQDNLEKDALETSAKVPQRFYSVTKLKMAYNIDMRQNTNITIYF